MPKKKAPRSSIPSLLILQCDSETLRRDGLAIAPVGADVACLVQRFQSMHVEVLEASGEQDLAHKLAHRSSSAFDVVVLIGHANEAGLQIASDRFASWAVVAEWLRPLQPRRLVLLACHAGRALPEEILFKKLVKLRRIYASPVSVSKITAEALLMFVPYVVLRPVPSGAMLRSAQVAIAALTGGQLREWTRNGDYRNLSTPAWDLVGDVIDPIIQRLRTRTWLETAA